MISPPNTLNEIKPNLVCELQTCLGRATAHLFLSLGWDQKVKISLNFNNKVNFNDFLYQIICVFLQTKDIKHIEQDFCFVAWAMPQDGI